MILSLYLHNDVTDVLKMYGNLNDVINKILDESSAGSFDVQNKPPCRNRDGASRYNVDVKNEDYLSMLESFGIKSKQISLRRLIYWFVENEIYYDLGWEPVRDYIDKNDECINRYVVRIKNEMQKLRLYMFKIGSNKMDILTHAEDLISSLNK